MNAFRNSPRINVIKCIKDIFPAFILRYNTSSVVISSFMLAKDVDIIRSLDLTVYIHNHSIVRFIVDSGRYDTLDNSLRLAAGMGYEFLVKLFIEKGANIHAFEDVAFRAAARYGHESVARYLFDKGANIHAMNDEALICAAEKGHESIVRFLVDKGCMDDDAIALAAKKGTCVNR